MSNVLIVANQTLAGEEISEFVKSRMGEEPRVHAACPGHCPHATPGATARLLGTISGGRAKARRCPQGR